MAQQINRGSDSAGVIPLFLLQGAANYASERAGIEGFVSAWSDWKRKGSLIGWHSRQRPVAIGLDRAGRKRSAVLKVDAAPARGLAPNN